MASLQERRLNNMEKDMYVERKLDMVEVSRIFDSIVMGIGTIIESRDINTGHHVFRSSQGVKCFVKHLQTNSNYEIDDKFCRYVTRAAALHDMGKISIPDAILLKPGRFEPEEYEIMKNHSAEGARVAYMLLSDIPDQSFVDVVMNMAKYHHEKWDGTGYPTGKAGEDIPLEARIMALADVFDALVSKRCYKNNYSFDKAFSIIEESLGTHFDPVLGKEFLACRPELEELYKELFDDEEYNDEV